MATRRHTTLWTFAITSIALFMVSLDNLVVTTALPVIRTDLDASLEQLEWTVNAYTLTFAVFLLTGAALGDRFGRRRMFALGLTVFTLGSVAAALAPTVEALILARAVQGLAQYAHPGFPHPIGGGPDPRVFRNLQTSTAEYSRDDPHGGDYSPRRHKEHEGH